MLLYELVDNIRAWDRTLRSGDSILFLRPVAKKQDMLRS